MKGWDFMKKIYTRKLVSLIAIVVLAFVVIYCLITGREIPQSANSIITAFIGFLGYYFGKSTALDSPNKGEIE